MLFAASAAIAACSAPPVDVALSVSLATAEQMTLRQSFGLRRDSLPNLDPHVRSIRYYPSLVASFELTEGRPLGYLVVDRGAHVASTPLVIRELDPVIVEEDEPGIEISNARDDVEPHHVVHSVRADGQEKLLLYRYTPDRTDFGARALVLTGSAPDPVGFEAAYSESIAGDVFENDPVPAVGAYAARWAPEEGERLAALVVSGTVLITEPFGIDADPSNGFTGSVAGAVSQAEAPATALEYGRVVLAEDLIGFPEGTFSYVNSPVSGRYRTFVNFSEAEPEYTELGLAGRLETVLASGELLTRSRDRWVISGLFGEAAGSFPAGRLQFVHERNDISGSDDWHAVFTLTYWGQIDDEDYLFVRVYSERSDRLSGID